MAILRNCATQRRICLRTEHLFGRSRLAHTILGAADASLLHASIRWTGQAWELRDFSRNGTTVDTSPAPGSRPVPLELGAKIEFCRDRHCAWTVEDLSEPTSMLWPLEGDAPAIALSEDTVVSGGPAEQAVIVRTEAGTLLCEQGGQTRILHDGDELRVGDRLWCFLSSSPVQETADLVPSHEPVFADAVFEFEVSLDEEHVSVQIESGRHAIKLGERSHHYCLLVLARKRIDDARRGIGSAAQGWVYLEDLARMLGTDTSHGNIQIFRARKQVVQSVPSAGGSSTSATGGEAAFAVVHPPVSTAARFRSRRMHPFLSASRSIWR